MAFYQANLRYLVGKLESTPGTAETLADADFNVRVRNVEYSPVVEMDDEGSKAATGDHTLIESIPGVRTCQVTFSMPWAWSGDAATPPTVTKFLQGCGLVEDTYALTGVGWTPKKAGDGATMTLEVYETAIGATPVGHKAIIAGAMGNCTLSAETVGGPLTLNFTFTGKLTDIQDVTNPNLLELTSPDTTRADSFLNNTFTLGGTAECISAFELDFGNDIQPVQCQSDATGVQYYRVASRQPRFSCNPLITEVSSNDVFSKVTTPTVEAISLAQPDGHLTITAPRAQNLQMGVGTREGLSNWDYNYKLLRNTAGATAIAKEQSFELLHGAKP